MPALYNSPANFAVVPMLVSFVTVGLNSLIVSVIPFVISPASVSPLLIAVIIPASLSIRWQRLDSV